MLLDSRAKIALRQHVDILVANTVNVLLTTTVFRPSAPVILVILGGNASSLATVMAVVFVECKPKDFQLALNVMLVSVENIAKRNAQISAAGMVTVTNMVNVNATKDLQVYHVYLKHAQDNAQVMVCVKNQASANAPKVTLATHVTFSSGDVKKIVTTMAPV